MTTASSPANALCAGVVRDRNHQKYAATRTDGDTGERRGCQPLETGCDLHRLRTWAPGHANIACGEMNLSGQPATPFSESDTIMSTDQVEARPEQDQRARPTRLAAVSSVRLALTSDAAAAGLLARRCSSARSRKQIAAT